MHRWLIASIMIATLTGAGWAADVVAELDAEPNVTAKCAYLRRACEAYANAAADASAAEGAAIAARDQGDASEGERTAAVARQHGATAVMMAKRADITRLLGHIEKTSALGVCREQCLRELGPLAPR